MGALTSLLGARPHSLLPPGSWGTAPEGNNKHPLSPHSRSGSVWNLGAGGICCAGSVCCAEASVSFSCCAKRSLLMHRRGAEVVGDSSEGPPQPGAVRPVGEMNFKI
jgi:hypothetical protein